MGKIVIGIIGASGQVGRVVLEILAKNKNYIIRSGFRSNKPTSNSNKNASWVYVDIYSPKSLYDFCNGCKIILNCAGPSYLIEDRIACVAQEVGATYIDAYGTENIKKSLCLKGIENNTLYVLGAGVYPGLSGIFSDYVAGFFDIVSCYRGMTGSFEPIGRAAAEDLLYSAASCFGIANAYWENHQIKIAKHVGKEKLFLPYINKEVFIDKFLNEEILHFIHKNNLEHAMWFNIMEREVYSEILSNAYKVIMQNKREEDFDKIVDKFVEETSIIDKPWNILIVEAEGVKGQDKIKRRGIVHNESAYRLTGIMMALVTMEISKKEEINGIYWPYEVIDSQALVRKMGDFGIKFWVEAYDESLLENKDDQELDCGVI